MNENIEKAILLLDGKTDNKFKYKDISKLTGYHEKSLIRLSRNLKKYGKERMLEKVRKGYNEPIKVQEGRYILDMIIQSGESSITKKYQYYLSACKKEKLFNPRSFSAVYSLLVKNDLRSCSTIGSKTKPKESDLVKEKNHIVIFKVDKLPKSNLFVYTAIDYKSLRIIKVLFSRKSEMKICADFLRYITENIGIPDLFYCYGSLLLRRPVYGQTEFARMCSELGIVVEYNYDNDAEGAYKLLKKELISNLTECIKNSGIKTTKELNELFEKSEMFSKGRKIKEIKYGRLPKSTIIDDIICIKRQRKVLSRNMVQFENGLYRILLPEGMNLDGRTKVKVLMDYNSHKVRVLYENEIYNVELIQIKTSKKFYE